MAALAMTLTEYQDSGNSRTSLRAGHTISLPKYLLERRKPPSGQVGSVAEYTVTVLAGTTDGTEPIQSRIRMSATIGVPVGAPQADIDAALAAFRDVVQSDELESSASSLSWLQP